MAAMPGAWAESPEICAKSQSLPAFDDDFSSYLTSGTAEDDDSDSVSSYETCPSTPCEELYQHNEPFSFAPHMPPRLLQSSRKKRRRSHTRLYHVNPRRWHERDGLKMLVQKREAQLASCEQKLAAAERGQAYTTVKMKRAQLELEKAENEHAVSKERLTARLDEAEWKVFVREVSDKSGDQANELRKTSEAQWQRANIAEQRVQCLENDLASARSDLQQACNANNQASTLQQQLDTSLQSLHSAEHEAETLRAALATSDNYANEVYRQAVEHIRSLTEAANQEVSRLNGLGAVEEARANRAEEANQSLQQRMEAQDAQVRSLQDEAQRWEMHANEHLERANLGATKVGELTREVSELKNRAQNAEAKVGELEQRIANTTVAEKGEATEEPSTDDMEAAGAMTSMVNRLEREIEDANKLLEELALKGMDETCQEALENLVKTNQVFKQIEEEFEDTYSPSVIHVSTILDDAMSDSAMRRFINLANHPVLVRQLKGAQHARTQIDAIVENAEIEQLVYLGEDQTKEIEQIIKAPRTLPEIDDADDAPSPPPRAPLPTTSTAATTSSPVYNPFRQAPTPTQHSLPGFLPPGQQIPGLSINPSASPTTGAPAPYNPLWACSQPANPSPSAPSTYRPHNPSSLRSLVPEYAPHEASPTSDSESDSEQDAEGDTDDDVMPEAFEGEHDYGSDYDDDESMEPSRPEPSRPMDSSRPMLPMPKRRRIARDYDEDMPIFM